MFVVRYRLIDEDDAYKAYVSLSDASRVFAGLDLHTPSDCESAALFQVVGETDARRALERVKAGDAQLLKRDGFSARVRDFDLDAFLGGSNAEGT